MSPDSEALQANELDTALTSLLAGQVPQASHTAPSADVALVTALVQLGRSIEPDSTFAAELAARLAAQAMPGTTSAGRSGRPERALARRRSSTRWRRWMSLAAIVLLALLLLAPPARAELQTLIRIGAVRIGLAPASSPTRTPQARPAPTPLTSLLDLAGVTTLAQARANAGFPVRLPTYPPDLGAPQYVFLQDLNGPMVALVWVDPAHPSTVRLSLFEMSSDVYVYKSPVHVVTETTVNGQRAVWTEGPYIVQVFENGQVAYATRVLVAGHALVWTDGAITYRLETTASLDDAVRIAESLR